MDTVPVNDDKMLKPRAILKLVEQEKSGLSDSGLMDSRNVTFSPEVSTKVIEFSPLVRTEENTADKSICAKSKEESESEELTLDSSLENAPEGPLQSSGLAEVNFNIADVSTIHHGNNTFRHNTISVHENLSL